MAIRGFGSGGGGGGAGLPLILTPHDITLGSGATWHWPLNGTGVEEVTGGAPYDLTGTLSWVPPGPGADEVGMLKATSSSSMSTGSIGNPAEIKGAITVAAWIYRTGAVAANLDICSARIAGAGSSNNSLWGLSINTSEQIRGWWQDGPSDNVNLVGDDAETACAQDEWEHWTLTRPTAGTSGKLYKNGTLIVEDTGLNKADGGESTGSLVIGHNKGGQEFPGFIATCIVFEEEMDATAVAALYASTFSRPSQTSSAVAHTPIDGTEADAVVAFTGANGTDLVGDSTLDQDTLVHTTNGNYTSTEDVFDTSTTQLVGTTGDTSHKVAIATPLTVAMMYKATALESTGYVFASSTTTSSFNYGLAHVTGDFSVRFGAHTGTGIPFVIGQWCHVCVTAPANRLSFKFYVNGALAYTSGAVTAGAVGGGDSLKIGNVGAANGDITGSFSDILIADAEYDAAAVRTLAENAFGHILV